MFYKLQRRNKNPRQIKNEATDEKVLAFILVNSFPPTIGRIRHELRLDLIETQRSVRRLADKGKVKRHQESGGWMKGDNS